MTMHDAREGKGTPGELKKKNRQAFQELSTGLEKKDELVRFEDD